MRFCNENFKDRSHVAMKIYEETSYQAGFKNQKKSLSIFKCKQNLPHLRVQSCLQDLIFQSSKIYFANFIQKSHAGKRDDAFLINPTKCQALNLLNSYIVDV